MGFDKAFHVRGADPKLSSEPVGDQSTDSDPATNRLFGNIECTGCFLHG